MAEQTNSKMIDNSDLITMNYRLSSIEKSISELKDVMLETKLQERDIKDLSENQKELLQAINSHDKRIKNLEIKPTQDKAERWQFILDYVFKTVVAGLVIYFLQKINIPVH